MYYNTFCNSLFIYLFIHSFIHSFYCFFNTSIYRKCVFLKTTSVKGIEFSDIKIPLGGTSKTQRDLSRETV